MKGKVLATLGALLVAAAGAWASDPVGVYALIDKVVTEPKEGTPERVQIWGVFVLASNGGRLHSEPARGHMYFTAVPGKEEVCRREWADLKKIAGTGKVVAFGNSRAATGAVRKPSAKPASAAPLDAAKLRALITDLGSDDFTTREKATRTLAKQGDHARGELKKALEGKVSPEARRRIDKLLATEKADPYPLGFGVTVLQGRHGEGWRNLLAAVPEPVSPTEGSAVATGKVTLRTKNIDVSDHKGAGYVFEIETIGAAKETSPVVSAGDKETEWSPQMQVQAGKRYTWRVRPVEGQWKGPGAETSFQGKSAQ